MKAIFNFRIAIVSTLLFFTFNFGFAQTQFLWQPINESSIPVTGTRYISAKQYSTMELNLNELKTILQTAPLNELPNLSNSNFLLDIPMPDGSLQTFKVSETPMMEPALAAMYPEIKTYSGAGLNNDGLYLKFDVTPQGFHGMILVAGQGTIYIDPYYFGGLNNEHYIIYKKKDFQSLSDKTFVCGVESPTQEPAYDPKMLGTCQLKTYRLALAATVEYTVFHGGTVALALAAQVTTMNRVNGVYERDCGVHMNIVANNNLLIYTTAPDPYTNNNGATMLGENQTNCNNVIGNANYDIGHVFSTGGGGIASLGSVCATTQKGQGVTGSPAPVGDPFDIDYVAHEMGHQFGGNHTFHSSQGACGGNMNNATSFEPGSGSTIQAYAGICAPHDLQFNSDDYFHGISLQEIANEIVSGGHACEVNSALTNVAPNISTPTATFQIPVSTPFSLTVVATDADPTNVLTYCWEQMNGGTLVTMPPVTTNASGPNFRSWDPSTNPTRYFPRLSDLAAGTVSPWEVLPAPIANRTLNFRVVVRDNAPGGGCNDHEDFIVNVNAASGPFVVTYPTATGITWNATTTQTVTWSVNNTNIAPISCANVDILLSTDGGLTYPITLLAGTPNDGTQLITVPNNPSTTCRVMVRAVGNVFFDISNNNFTITAPTSDYSLTPTISSVTVCPPTIASFPINVGSIGGYVTAVTLSVSGVPAGASSSFTTNPVIPGNSTTLNINPGTAVAGTYSLTVQGNSASGIHTIPLTLIISSSTPGAVTLISPANGATNQPTTPTFSWNALAGTGITYSIDIATDAGFTTIVNSSTGLVTNSYTPGAALASGTIHYWRVRGVSGCGTGPNSATFNFTTGTTACSTFVSTNVPITISATGTPTVTSTLNIPTLGTITDVNVVNLGGTHTWISDLTIRITSPLGTQRILFANICNDEDNFSLNFDDEATPGALPCPPIGGGTYQPNQTLSAIDGQAMNGTWTLTIVDGFNQDGGSLTSWGLNICYLVPPPTCSLAVSTTPVNRTCGINNGSATANVSNSTGAVSYVWSNGGSTSTITGLAAATYTVTVSDVSGCTASATAIVGNTADVTSPVATCQNVTVYLDNTGNRTITGATINNGSTDNCSVASLTANPSTFNCSDISYPNAQRLFISEYIEGNGNNKCIEIANFTGASVDLAAGGYQLKIFNNGSATPVSTTNLTGVIPNNNVFVICNNGAGATFLAQADQQSVNLNYNGNDAILLSRTGNDTVDIFGKIACNPGTQWVNGAFMTADRTLRRNPDVSLGVLTNPSGTCNTTSFTTLTTQWAVFAIDNNANLGAHTYSTLNPVVLTVTDGNANTASCTAQVTVLDTVRPTITAPANVSIPPNSGCNATGVALGSSVTADNCSVATISNNAPGTYPSGTTIVIWTVTDGSGNTKTASQTVTVTDNIAPVPNVVSLPNAGGQCSVTLTAPTATDNCLGAITGTTANPTTYNTQGTFVVTWSYTDGAGNTSTQNQTVIVDDVTNPVTPTLSNFTGQCSVTPTAPTTTDNCVGTVTGTTPTTFPITFQGTTVVTWTFNDGNGNITTANQNIILDDVINPVTPTLSNVTGQCSVTPTAPTTTDNCVGTVTGTTPTTFPITTQGTTVVTWTFNDGNGNITTTNQDIILDDVTNPVTPTLSNVTGQCSITPTAPTTTDNCVGIVTGTTATAFPITFQGTTVVTWTFNDGNGNITTANQNIILDDITNPVTPTLSNVTGQCSATPTAPTTTDNCVGTVTGTTATAFPITTQGTTVVTWTFNDGNGNSITANQNIILDDVTNPVTPTLANLTGQCSVTPTAPTTTDNCVGIVTGTTLTTFPITTQGTTVVTWTFNDGNGNSITANQNVIIDDVSAPIPNVSSLPAATVDCVTPVTAPTATDNCAGAITATTTDPLVYPTAGTYTIQWTYNDGNGNTSTQSQTVIADDQVGPVVSSCPANINVFANTSGCNAIVTWTVPSATDACSGVGSSSSNNPGDIFTLGTTTVTYTFTDMSGNSSSCSFDVTVTNDLSISGTASDEIGGNDGSVDITISGGSSPYNVLWSGSETTEDINGLQAGVYSVTVTDVNGCTSTSSFTVNSQMSVNEHEDEIISIYPNPTSSFVQINAMDDRYKNYKLHNSLGQVILVGGFNKTLTIDMTVYANGIYHLTIDNKTYKIIRR